MEDKKVLLSIKDLEVKFHVRGRILTAIRGISLDIYENESIAIVGESGSGKSVFTKTFAGMLEDNGFISQGSIIYNDPDLDDTYVKKGKFTNIILPLLIKALNKNSKLEYGSDLYLKILNHKETLKDKINLDKDEAKAIKEKIADLEFNKAETYNYKLTLDPKNEKELIKAKAKEIKSLEKEIESLKKSIKNSKKQHLREVLNDKDFMVEYKNVLSKLKEEYKKATNHEITEEQAKRNEILAKEIILSVGRYSGLKKYQLAYKLVKAYKKAMKLGADLKDEKSLNSISDTVVFRVKYLDENEKQFHGNCTLDLTKVKYTKDWQQIRGKKIATVFQDPMTSLNPIITIGKQITSIILKHQNCSEIEARERAILLMKKVGIPNAENRFDDYPFQYSGGMRQRIVIAIALSCQPKILICDEPTTALDVTIQAQILKLIKDLQKEFNYTIVFITHDLGVVANVADRVAVLYAGQIIELGSVDEIFYDPRHPYTWALLSSLPQLAEKNTELYSITGTPPSLYNKIIGDPFAPRNPYCLKIDTILDSPMFKVSETHYAKTWLLDPRSPKIEKPDTIKDIHNKLIKAFNVKEAD